MSQAAVSIQNLLKHLHTANTFDFPGTHLSEKASCRFPIRMCPPGDVHRNIRVDEDLQRRPTSISESILRMSAVGAPREARRSTGSAWFCAPDDLRSSVSIARRTHSPFETRLRSAAFRIRVSNSSAISTWRRWLICSCYYLAAASARTRASAPLCDPLIDAFHKDHPDAGPDRRAGSSEPYKRSSRPVSSKRDPGRVDEAT